MSFKPIDAKRDEYRKYLERTGVMEVLSKALLKLFETTDKPENAVEFVRNNLGDAMLERDTIEHLRCELVDAHSELAHLKRQLDSVNIQYAKTLSELQDAAMAVATPLPAEETVVADTIVAAPLTATEDVPIDSQPVAVIEETVVAATVTAEVQQEPEPVSSTDDKAINATADDSGIKEELDTTTTSTADESAVENNEAAVVATAAVDDAPTAVETATEKTD